VFELHATDYRLARVIGMPFSRIDHAGNQPAPVFDDGQG